jgi:hypothetical protein
MVDVTAAVEIDAKPSEVWAVLTDFEGFHEWNPFIRNAYGSTELGGTVHVRVWTALPVLLGFSAKILSSEPGRKLRWRGKLISRWLGAGDHVFEIEPLADGRARLVQHETFTGILPRLAHKVLARETQRGFEAMNCALAARVARVRP